MGFVFRLQTVLDHRHHLEDLAFAQFAHFQKVQQQCELHLAWLGDEMTRARFDLAGREQAGMPAKDFILANEYVTVLRLQVLREQARLPMLKAQTEEARLKLVEATKDRKVLESLRDTHRADYDRQELLAEQRLLDEVAVGSFARRNIT
ncbi:MAG: flagellar export protein FliJ [Pseudomonadota bacterium]